MVNLKRYLSRFFGFTIIQLVLIRLFVSSGFFHDMIISKLQESCQQCQIELKSIKPYGLIGFEAKEFKFYHQKSQKTFELESLKISATPFSQLLVLRAPLTVDIEFADEGRVIVQSNHPLWKKSSFQSFENLKIVILNTYLETIQKTLSLFQVIPLHASFLNAKVKGVMLINQGKGKGSLRIQDPEIQIPGRSSLKFEPMRTRIELQNGALSFEPIQLKSRLGTVSMLGSIEPLPFPEHFQIEFRSTEENHLSDILGRIVSCRGLHTRISGNFNNPYCFRFPPGSLSK